MKLAMIQMLVIPGAPERNRQHALELVDEAAGGGAGVILLPEALNLGWTDLSARDQADRIPGGPLVSALQSAAQKRRVYICAGLVEQDSGQLFNSAVLIDANGGIALMHRKLNELEIAHSVYGQGNHLGVSHTPIGSMGVMICADAFAPGQVISRSLGYMGASIILSPCAWAVLADHDNEREPYGQLWLENYAPVARDFQLWIAGTSNVGPIHDGPWKGRKCIGCSLLISPEGEPVLKGPYGEKAETILFHDIELRPRPARGDAWARLQHGG